MTDPITWVTQDPHKEHVFWPSEAMKERAWISDESIYAEAAADPEKFWSKHAEELRWFKRWSKISGATRQPIMIFGGSKRFEHDDCLIMPWTEVNTL